jgi:CBS domain-containing protein
MENQSPLPTRRLDRGAALAQVQPTHNAPVTLDSPALAVMTDLTQVKAASTSPSTSLRQAEQIMIYQGVRMLFVVSAMPAIEGLITTTDLQGDRPMRVVQQRNLRHDELSVADVMTPLSMMDAIDYDDVRHARVEHVIATLQRHGRNHLLVMDREGDGPAASGTNPCRVRGVLSRAQIERQLGRPIEVPEIAHSFAELGQMLS